MISLSLCMIVKNEEKVLPRILKPMKEIVDKILICDTGSTDRTKEIIREFTAEVYDFPWKNDFSAARNFISEKVSTDYWMWLDADDMITQENLDVRTITLGISLLDCIDSDLETLNRFR